MMTVAWYWARSELRQRWRTWIAVALLVGIGGGLSLASLAAARRTDSALPRFLERADAPDLVVDPDFGPEGDSDAFLDAVEALPGVEHRSDARAIALGRVVDGVIDVGTLGAAVASVDGDRYYEHDRVHLVQGRLPDPDRADEILVSTSEAEEGPAVGDRLEFRVLDVEALFASLESGESEILPDAGEPLTLEITGIGIFPEGALVEEEYAQDRIMLTPALYAELPPHARLWDRTGFHLGDEVEIPVIRREIQDLAAEMGGATLFEVRPELAARAQRSVRPYVLALAGLGVAGAIFVLLLTTQLVRRTVALTESQRRVLRSLAAEPMAVRVGAALPAVLAAIVATIVALAVMALVSGSTPVGPVRPIEPSPGVAVDWLVVAPGVFVLVLATVLPALLVRRSGLVVASHGTPPLRLASWAQRAGAPLRVVVGLGQVAGPSGEARRTGARAGLVSVALAIGMLGAIVTFSASLGHLLDHPESHGWNADVALLGADGYGTFDLRGVSEVDGIEAASAAVFGSFSVGDTDIAGMGVAKLRGELLPPLLDGRAPQGMDEIVLGRSSLAKVGGEVGDTLDVRLPGDGETMPMTVVGTAVFPGIGQFDNERPTLADGALVVLPDDMIGEIDMGWSVVLVDLAPGADHDTTIAALVTAADELAGETDVFELMRPADIAALDRLGAVPILLVALFVLVAVGALGHVLVVSGRTWRRDRAVLATLGATPGDLRSALRWQGAAIVGVAAVAGVPVGAALGRWAWRSLATEIGVVPDPVLPFSVLALAVGGLVVVAVLTAVLGDRAMRSQLAEDLRTER